MVGSYSYFFLNCTASQMVVCLERRGLIFYRESLEPGEAARVRSKSAGRFAFAVCCRTDQAKPPPLGESFREFWAEHHPRETPPRASMDPTSPRARVAVSPCRGMGFTRHTSTEPTLHAGMEGGMPLARIDFTPPRASMGPAQQRGLEPSPNGSMGVARRSSRGATPPRRTSIDVVVGGLLAATINNKYNKSNSDENNSSNGGSNNSSSNNSNINNSNINKNSNKNNKNSNNNMADNKNSIVVNKNHNVINNNENNNSTINTRTTITTNNRGGSGLRPASISAGNKQSESHGIWGDEGTGETRTRGRGGGESRSSCSSSGSEELAGLRGVTSGPVVVEQFVRGGGGSPGHFKYRKPGVFALCDTFCAFSGGGSEAISLHDMNEKIFRSYEPVIRRGH